MLKKLAQKRYPREVCELVYQAWQASKAPGSEYATCVSCYSSLGFAHDGCSKCGGGCCHNGECAPECSACNKMFCMWCSHMHDSKCAACGEMSMSAASAPNSQSAMAANAVALAVPAAGKQSALSALATR